MSNYQDRDQPADLQSNPRRGFGSGIAAAIVLAVLALLGLVFWSSSNRPTQTINPGTTTTGTGPGAGTSPGVTSANPAPPPATSPAAPPAASLPTTSAPAAPPATPPAAPPAAPPASPGSQ